MMTIRKYQLEVTDEQEIELPNTHRLLSVQEQNGTPCLWALVDPDAASMKRMLRIFGTGQPIKEYPNADFLGTFQLHGGRLVFHVFADRVMSGLRTN